MGKLFIVGTPIGNLDDITLRAIKTLENVDVVACEDTRRTMILLNHLQIKKKTIAYHDKNESNSANGILKLIESGKNVAVVSDAGMPLVSDPGYVIVKLCIDNNIPIEVIPGPSATIHSLAISGFDTKFSFHGFLSPKTQKAKNQISAFQKGTHILFVSPYKLLKTLESISEINNEWKLALCKELTKIHEKVYRGSASEVIDMLNEDGVKGEFTLAISVD